MQITKQLKSCFLLGILQYLNLDVGAIVSRTFVGSCGGVSGLAV